MSEPKDEQAAYYLGCDECGNNTYLLAVETADETAMQAGLLCAKCGNYFLSVDLTQVETVLQ